MGGEKECQKHSIFIFCMLLKCYNYCFDEDQQVVFKDLPSLEKCILDFTFICLVYLLNHLHVCDKILAYHPIIHTEECLYLTYANRIKNSNKNKNLVTQNSAARTKHPAKFSDHKSPESRNIIFQFATLPHVDQVIKGSCDFKVGSLSSYVNTLPSLVSIGLLQVEICI